MTPDAVLSYIETLCETVISLSGELGSTRKDNTLRQLKQAIDDYFASVPPPGDLGVSVTDSMDLNDFFG